MIRNSSNSRNIRKEKVLTKAAESILFGIAVSFLFLNLVWREGRTVSGTALDPNSEVMAEQESEATEQESEATEQESEAAESDSETAESGLESAVENESEITAESLQASIASKILRFHVLANSDSEEDQALKLLVRDAVGVYLEPLLSEADELAETEEIVIGHLRDIEDTAEAVISQEGYDYPVEAYLAWVEFPEKTYGDYTFPAGEYEALELVIGEGDGRNWWCVLYPNMCFRGSVYEVVDEDAEEELRQVLTAEEYEEVFSSGEVEVRFRLLEFLRGIFS